MSGAVRPDDAAQFYDRLSAAFLEHAGATFQAGLLRGVDGVEDAVFSNVALARRAGVVEGSRVLDAGCGVAGPALHIASAIHGVTVEGLTISPVQVRLATERIAAAGLRHRVRVQLGDYHALPFSDRSFDVVLFLESCEYARDRDLLFAEVRRVLVPGGRVYIKGALRREGPQTEQQAVDLAAYNALWALASTPSPGEIVGSLHRAGFLEVASDWLDLGGSHFLGAMFELGPQGLRPNAFGQAMFRRFIDLPVAFAEVTARTPQRAD